MAGEANDNPPADKWYKWTERDYTAAQKAAGGAKFDKDDVYRYVTPYGILPLTPPDAATLKKGDLAKVSFGDSKEAWRVTRFTKAGMSWKEAPGDITEKTLEDLSKKLFERDPVLYAPHDLGKLSAQDKSEFCKLHFEYWRNTEYRYAVTEIRSGDGDPTLSTGFDYALLKSQANTLPTAAKGMRMHWVLVKTPKTGGIIVPPPIKKPPDLPNPPPKKPGDNESTVVALLKPEIVLDTWSKQPIEIMKKDGTAFLVSKLKFKVTLDGKPVKTLLQIRKNGDVVYEESYDSGQYTEKGDHPWEWDGFDKDGVLDTASLKKNRYAARVVTIDAAGRTAFGSASLKISTDGMAWVDVVAKRPDKTLEVTVYGKFTNMSDVPSIPVPAIAIPPYTNVAPPADSFLDPALFTDFRKNIIDGIAKYWSRDALTVGSEDWKVKTVCVERSWGSVPTILGHAMTPAQVSTWMAAYPSVAAVAIANGVGERSFNVATFADGLPVVDLYIAGESTDEREYTGAHELGHSVLRELGGADFSLTHKGSSTRGQAQVPGVRYPAAPEDIDVMKYYDEPPPPRPRVRPPKPYARIKAVQDDVRALISLAKVMVTG